MDDIRDEVRSCYIMVVELSGVQFGLKLYE